MFMPLLCRHYAVPNTLFGEALVVACDVHLRNESFIQKVSEIIGGFIIHFFVSCSENIKYVVGFFIFFRLSQRAILRFFEKIAKSFSNLVICHETILPVLNKEEARQRRRLLPVIFN